ncbi:hypothetical protein CLAFUW4_07695 [Fulvia fulva]|uniref:Uncharacterized protein n=1 Tax=Passalora fulva TaxID=5499 RepID=A0A9Q8LCS3_PASFU|nr:uncharacterized protein CLAFUR5_07823 [Fulvia fulva]KAK4628928.1 hypothetical protein CLAFUR4_07700 [Fulvia fulva]KAK4630778.1 hypothetical protein CLAFUR0_07698 [Fulvia fulva]UJO15033.1 hypothetical protein CLAFUR5_07823 [Fulvia fulva]WPV12373.1 hypothetical protein CLAFUW4_07695 [Fulvia fulva]WPV27102.1 hypothetical protein CLAFUW7_07696 [Fulvia fulva]
MRLLTTLIPILLPLSAAWRVEWTLLDGTRLWSTGTFVDSGSIDDTTNCMTVPWTTPMPIKAVEWWEYKDNTINATKPGWAYWHPFKDYFEGWGNPNVGSFRVYWAREGGRPPPSKAEREAAEAVEAAALATVAAAAAEGRNGVGIGNGTVVGNGSVVGNQTVVRKTERVRREVHVRI